MDIIYEQVVQYAPQFQVWIELLREHSSSLQNITTRVTKSLHEENGPNLGLRRIVITLKVVWDDLKAHDMKLVILKLKELYNNLEPLPINETYEQYTTEESRVVFWNSVDMLMHNIDIENIYKNLPKIDEQLNDFIKHMQNARDSFLSLCMYLV
jgi:hypothetical protein